MNPKCRQSRKKLHFSTSSVLTSWKNPVSGLQVQRSYVLDCCHGPEEVYTEWCNISHCPFLPLSPPPSLPHHYFSLFLSPQCNLIRLDCPLATSPSGHVALYPLPSSLPPSLPPSSLIPIPLEWKWSDWCPATLYHSAAVPLQLVASVMPYSQINQSDPRCAYWSLS